MEGKYLEFTKKTKKGKRLFQADGTIQLIASFKERGRKRKLIRIWHLGVSLHIKIPLVLVS